MSTIRYRDKLRDRGFVDQWGFITFAAIGFGGIVLAKIAGAPTGWVAAGAIAAMLGYALLVGVSGTGRLRADQAGDNCYYLGLIYTLASLSHAIATFDPGNTAETIVQGFGVALATTVVGLVLRVFFNQGRPDLENHEEEIRLELTEASRQLKGEVRTVVRNVNDTSRVMGQAIQEMHQAASKSMQEMHAAATASITDFAAATVEEIGKVVQEASETIRSEANDFAARSKRYSTSFDKLLAKLEEQSGVIEQISRAHDALLGTVDASVQASAAASTSVAALAAGAGEAMAAAAAAGDAVASLRGIASELKGAAADLRSGVESFGEQVNVRLDELRAGPVTTVNAAIAALGDATQAVQAQIVATEAVHRKVHGELVARTEEAAEAANRHTRALEAELEKSRALVERVHTSLVDMTGRLADTVEAKRP